MKELLKRAAGGLRAGKELYRKLSRPERISLAVVAAILVFAVLALSLFEGRGTYRQILAADGADGGTQLQRLAARLDEAGIEWKEGQTRRGAPTLEVLEASYEHALQVLDQDHPQSASESSFDLADKGSLFDPPDRFEARLRDANRKKIEQAILRLPSVRMATLVLSSQRRSVWAQSRDPDDSATVALYLRPGIASLRRQEVDTIREMVRCAFCIRPEKIAINDNLGNPYTANEVGGAGFVLEREDRLRNLLKEEIHNLYAKVFDEREFHVGLTVSLSPQRSSIEKKETKKPGTFVLEKSSVVERVADAETGGILSANTTPIIIRETTESVPFDSYEKTLTDIPPGELKGVSVVAHFDLDAVERVEAARQALPSQSAPLSTAHSLSDRELVVQNFSTREEAWIRNLLSTHGSVQVSVMVHPFRKTPLETLPESTRIAGLEPAPFLPEAGALALRWWRPLLYVAAAGVVLLAAVCLARARRRSPAVVESWPGPSPSSIVEESSPGQDGDWHASRPLRQGERVGVLRTVDDISTVVRDRPEVAASVLRLWLAQDAEEAREETARA